MMVKALVNWKDSSDDRFDWHRPSVFLSDHDTAWRVTGTRVMTHDTWQSPEPSPGHYAPHLPSSPADDPRIVDSRLARISSLLSGARVAQVSDDEPGLPYVWHEPLWPEPLSRNYVKCPDKKPILRSERESRDPRGDGGVTESTECDSYYPDTMRTHGSTSACQSFYHFNSCIFGIKSSELWVQAL